MIRISSQPIVQQVEINLLKINLAPNIVAWGDDRDTPNHYSGTALLPLRRNFRVLSSNLLPVFPDCLMTYSKKKKKKMSIVSRRATGVSRLELCRWGRDGLLERAINEQSCSGSSSAHDWRRLSGNHPGNLPLDLQRGGSSPGDRQGRIDHNPAKLSVLLPPSRRHLPRWTLFLSVLFASETSSL